MQFIQLCSSFPRNFINESIRVMKSGLTAYNCNFEIFHMIFYWSKSPRLIFYYLDNFTTIACLLIHFPNTAFF